MLIKFAIMIRLTQTIGKQNRFNKNLGHKKVAVA